MPEETFEDNEEGGKHLGTSPFEPVVWLRHRRYAVPGGDRPKNIEEECFK